MKKHGFSRLRKLFAGLLASFIVVPGIVTVCTDINGPLSDYINYVETKADVVTMNRVYFEKGRVDANTSNLVRVNLCVEGLEGETIYVKYSTKSGTAVQDVDFKGVENTLSFEFKKTERRKYEISIKVLNDSTTREILGVRDSTYTYYSRYFTINIDSAYNQHNVPVNTGYTRSCKCSLLPQYTVEATVGQRNDAFGREEAYLNYYTNVLDKHVDGTDSLDGKSTWRSWQHGLSIEDSVKNEWARKLVDTGIADIYGTFIAESVDDDAWHSKSNMMLSFGTGDMKYNYNRSTKDAGLLFYIETEPCKGDDDELDGTAMEYIRQKKNPHKYNDDYVDVVEWHYVSKDSKQIYFKQPKKHWNAKEGAIYGSGFWKITPDRNGDYNMCVAVYNNNSEWDREFHDPIMYMVVSDSTAPTLKGQWAEYDKDNNKIRIYLRFNEPVYTSKKKDLSKITINNFTNEYNARYVEGNYSDTLVYELENQPSINITKMTYQLPDQDIGDMAYNLDIYGNAKNNLIGNTDQTRELTVIGGNIDLTLPSLGASPSSSGSPLNVYNIMVTADQNERGFREGTVYYIVDQKDETTFNASCDEYDPASYSDGNARVLTEDDQGSFPVTIANRDAGNYYLHTLVVSKYGVKKVATYGAYLLDGRAPIIEQTSPNPNNLTSKTFNLTVNKKTDPATGVKNVTVYTKYTKDNKTVTDSYPLFVNGERATGVPVSVAPEPIDSTGTLTYRYVTNLANANDHIKALMGDSKHFEAEVYFVLEDNAGNKATSNSKRVVYDTRESFEVSVTIPASPIYQEVEGVGSIADKIYNIENATASDGITFFVTDAWAAMVDDGAVFTLIVNGEEIPVDDERVVYTDAKTITLANASAGYYSVVAHLSGNAPHYESNIDKISGQYKVGSAAALDMDSYSYYLTKGNDVTPNKERIEGNIVLSNQVYEVSDVKFVYYDETTKTISSHAYGATYNESSRKYEGGSLYPAFSSSIEAKKYFKYMELQDLYVEKINETIAQYLNSGTGSVKYVKAPGETKVAQSGQLWIRYKRNTWKESSDENAWAYYYYGTGSAEAGINYNDLSLNLNSAIETVVNTICKSGKVIYLVDEEHLNQSTGAPYLSSGQIHSSREEVTQTKSGNPYVSTLAYEGDSAIYKNTVHVSYPEGDYPLANNMPLYVDGFTSLYLKLSGDNWQKIEATDGMTIEEALPNIQVSNVYTIREYSDKGISEFSFYLDKSRPDVTVFLDGATSPIHLDETDINISARSLVFEGMATEYDEYAYVAIFTYPYKNLVDVLYANTISGYTITNGNYYLQVGDRSGNSLTYRLLTSNTAIDLSIAENDSKTAVVVKVNNRSSSEIYSYEVYLNEVLIDSDFADTKVFRDSGVYRVVVRDIYGNNQHAILSHDSPTPEMTWYYINSNGGTSKYDPLRIDRLIVQPDENNSRLTNLYGSSLVSVTISSAYEAGDIGFEMIGLDTTEYSYVERTGLISVNTLKGWKLRVWYKSNPDVDMLYVFQVDSQAPSISGNYTGDSFVQSSTIDSLLTRYDASTGTYNVGDIVEVNHDIYSSIAVGSNEIYRCITAIDTPEAFDIKKWEVVEAGEIISLANLEYTTRSSLSLTIEDGDVISGSRVNFVIEDPSGIKEDGVSVYRDGKLIDATFDRSTSTLYLPGYGKFLIIATDRLGNTARYEFTNVDGSVSESYVDETEIYENTEVNYGHSNLTVNTNYEGRELILVKTPSDTYTYVFDYDGSVLEYGYYCVISEVVDENTIKDVNYKSVGEVFDVTDDRYRRNTWYPIVRDVYFIISVMVDDSNKVSYKVECVSQEISIESLYIVAGNKIPNRYVATLSKAESSVELYSGNDLIENTNREWIYISNDLTVGDDVDVNVTKIEVAFSKNSVFDTFETIYENGLFKKVFVGEENGFYCVRVTNIYNNTKSYQISKILTFNTVVKIHVLDGSEVLYYEYPEDEPICSNFSIELIVFSDEVTFKVNDVITSGYVEGSTTVLTIRRQGTFNVRVLGANGIFEDFLFEIMNDDTFVFLDDWVTGYNKDALLANEYYTNTKCDINLDVDDRVVFVDMVVNDDLYVKLYDNITNERMIDVNNLKGAVGRYGTGTYVIGFRNKYGDLVKHTVHYSDEPGLVLTRRITADPNYEQAYDIGIATYTGFYSNYVLTFSTTSKNYIFTINGESYRLETPKTIEFTNISGKGSFSYRVTFKDEYGNYVEFNAILNRDDVEIDTSKMRTTTVNSELYTKDDVKVLFADDLVGTVSIDDAAAVLYESGKTFYKDGKYRFVIEDAAGNQNVYTINHKSMNHYRLFVQSNDTDIIPGGVINNGTVTFSASDDSQIKYVYRNGELQSDYSSINFSTTGYWALIIEDSIGNRSYEDFYVINNSLNKFEYTAPYDFEVTEVWRVSADGTREILTKKGKTILLNEKGNYAVVVTSTKTTSSFNFTITIDDTKPQAKLVGAEDGGVTAKDVTLTGLSSGDVVRVYKNGALISTTTVGLSSSSPKVDSSGTYRITITNIQGETIEYNFVRRPIASISASVFIVISCALAIVGMGVGLIYHTKLKADD